ncbi:helix-turn-helix domain-containing protein [Neomegalonema perideroedes]|uniref:helix-turn-helix domain-containing protein n=1 Tax=Neomegalonema perideroedes TaxID=217219 RepID=UPI00036D45AC|nr:helix-turn-helix domain-containing protein [Neomegalonema perideroedes]
MTNEFNLKSDQSLAPLAVSPAEAARLAGVGRTTLYAALSARRLRSFKLGKRRLISMAALREWLEACEAAQIEEPRHVEG